MRNYRTLDAIVVVGSLMMLGGVLYALIMINIPSDQLPIVAGLAGTIFGGTVGAYGGARWASKSKTDEPHAPGDVSVSVEARAPLADAPATEGTGS